MRISRHPSRCNTNRPHWYAKDYKVYSLERFDEVLDTMMTFVWSPIVWKNGKRNEGSFVSASAIALDFDKPNFDLARAKDWLDKSSYAYVIATTKSHQIEKKSEGGKTDPPCDRFRVVIPAANSVESLDVFKYNMDWWLRNGRPEADNSCSDGARYFWPCTKIVASAFDGASYEWKPIPDDYLSDAEKSAVSRETMRRFAAQMVLPPWIIHSLKYGYPNGGRHKRCYALGAALTNYGMLESDICRRVLLSPLADIGEADVRRAVRNGVERAEKVEGADSGKVYEPGIESQR